MSGLGDWFRSFDSGTTRTRLMMIGACVGAILLLATSMAFSWPAAVGGGGSPADTAEQARAEAFDSPTGSCLTWDPDTGADMRRVDCAEPHLFEVTSNVDISLDHPPEAPPPDVTRWQTIAEEKCTPGVTTYLGGTLDPFGRFKVNALKPTDAQWADGDRKLRCGVQRSAPSGALMMLKGSASEQDQSNVHEPGTCLALLDGQDIGDPIDCAEPHAVEIVGNIDLSETFTKPEYPSEEAQIEKTVELCAELTDTYSGGLDLAAKNLISYPETLQPESWEAGSRRIDCKVAAKLADDSGLAPVTGSVRKAPTDVSTTSVPTPTSGG